MGRDASPGGGDDVKAAKLCKPAGTDGAGGMDVVAVCVVEDGEGGTGDRVGVDAGDGIVDTGGAKTAARFFLGVCGCVVAD